MSEETSGIWSPWFVLGILVGTVLTIAASILLFSTQNFGVVKEFQTLIGALVALIGALITVRAIQRQIAQTRTLDEAHRQRRHEAARALLPAALAELCEYSEACVSLLLMLRPRGPLDYSALVEAPESGLPDVPEIPKESIPILRDCIESAGPRTASHIAELAKKLQIQNSRFRGKLAALNADDAAQHHGVVQVLTFNSIDQGIVDALGVYAHTCTLFGYARGETGAPLPEVSLQEMTSAAFNCGVSDASYPEIFEAFNRQFSDTVESEHRDS